MGSGARAPGKKGTESSRLDPAHLVPRPISSHLVPLGDREQTGARGGEASHRKESPGQRPALISSHSSRRFWGSRRWVVRGSGRGRLCSPCSERCSSIRPISSHLVPDELPISSLVPPLIGGTGRDGLEGHGQNQSLQESRNVREAEVLEGHGVPSWVARGEGKHRSPVEGQRRTMDKG